MFGKRNKLSQLVRLIPFCERNYNLIELGPKGTGKSHVYSEFSPHGILLSGGEVSVAKLFVNNASGRIGLVGYWDVVAFDEFAGKKKRADKALVDILKNYMANKSGHVFSLFTKKHFQKNQTEKGTYNFPCLKTTTEILVSNPQM